VPDQFKLARVIPIYKKRSKSVVSNYRPISLLSVFNKILEKLMYKRGQFGFRSNHSATHAILLIADKIQKAVENKMYSCDIFLDLSKAFDTVNHTILLKKLENSGIRGIVQKWFSSSYLSNRKQYVSIGNVISEQKSITCGVPQGSVLGLYYFCYILMTAS
jgi:retron-type reverse transcriptase